jgi:hypothetical protein
LFIRALFIVTSPSNTIKHRQKMAALAERSAARFH